MQEKTGSRMPRANMDNLLTLEIPLHLLTEQQRIVSILSGQMAAVARARKALDEELATTRILPAALLRRAFSGGL